MITPFGTTPTTEMAISDGSKANAGNIGLGNLISKAMGSSMMSSKGDGSNKLGDVYDHAWGPLQNLLGFSGVAKSCAGVADQYTPEARAEACAKIVGNHCNLLKDICNPRPTLNIDGTSLTQTELIRVDASFSQYVDEGLREAARRLLGRGQPTILHPSPEAQEARAACARYLYYRIQSTPGQKPGRSPDMGEEAAAAMKAVLVEVGFTSWEPLKTLLSRGAAEEVVGAAASFSKAARLEAAGKLVGNHFNLLQDVCNPRGGTNIDDVPLTQTELIRISAASARYVDEGLREVARRLLGRSKPDSLSSTKEAEEARAACARYLATRIQSAEAHKPGRTPDMGEEAAAVMKAVLNEV